MLLENWNDPPSCTLTLIPWILICLLFWLLLILYYSTILYDNNGCVWVQPLQTDGKKLIKVNLRNKTINKSRNNYVLKSGNQSEIRWASNPKLISDENWVKYEEIFGACLKFNNILYRIMGFMKLKLQCHPKSSRWIVLAKQSGHICPSITVSMFCFDLQRPCEKTVLTELASIQKKTLLHHSNKTDQG